MNDEKTYIDEQLDSLDDGLEGFVKLFKAISKTVRKEVVGLAAGTPVVAPEPVAELEALRAELEQTQESLMAKSEELSLLSEEFEGLKLAHEKKLATGQVAKPSQKPNGPTWDALNEAESRANTFGIAMKAANADSQAAWDKVRELDGEIEKLSNQSKEAELRAQAAEKKLAEKLETPSGGWSIKHTSKSMVPTISSATVPGGTLLPAFLSALTVRAGRTVGAAIKGMAFSAGKDLGERLAAEVPKTSEIPGALETVRGLLEKHECVWDFSYDAGNPLSLMGNGRGEVVLTFGECMSRSWCKSCEVEMGGPMCFLLDGLFSGMFETVTGLRTKLEVRETGDAQCSEVLRVWGV